MIVPVSGLPFAERVRARSAAKWLDRDVAQPSLMGGSLRPCGYTAKAKIGLIGVGLQFPECWAGNRGTAEGGDNTVASRNSSNAALPWICNVQQGWKVASCFTFLWAPLHSRFFC